MTKTNTLPPAELAQAAYHGPAGELVKLIEPESEADPVALLAQALVAFGNCIDRTAHFTVEEDMHHLKLFIVLVGTSSKGRKGTSFKHIKKFFEAVDPVWKQACIGGGLSSGEGLIWSLRDPIYKVEPKKDGKGKIVGYQKVMTDEGVADKRRLCVEEEFAMVLKVMARQGNILTDLIRRAWDDGDLHTMTKNFPARATGAHVSIIGHVTREDLRQHLSATDQANGFGNRFLWLAVRRSKLKPLGGKLDPHALVSLAEKFRLAVQHARSMKETPLDFDHDARAYWCEIYSDLSEGKPGLAGAMCGRAEAQVRRLACLYALLDLSNAVRLEHLHAALAFWKYAEETVQSIFGDSLGNRDAESILLHLQEAEDGLTRSQINDTVFKGHKQAIDIQRALDLLQALDLAHCKQLATGGRAAEKWLHGPDPAKKAGKAG